MHQMPLMLLVVTQLLPLDSATAVAHTDWLLMVDSATTAAPQLRSPLAK